jgi:hypothetical protein
LEDKIENPLGQGFVHEKTSFFASNETDYNRQNAFWQDRPAR